MNSKNKQEPGFSALRRKAEKRLKSAQLKQPDGPPSYFELQHLVHELEIHKIELEMQHEELLQSRAEAEKGLERYTQLYDIVPLGFLTLSRNGTIVEVNLPGAKLLGMERSLLHGDRFGRFIVDEDLPVFNSLLDRVFSKRYPWYCEVRLFGDQPSSQVFEPPVFRNPGMGNYRIVRIEAVLSSNGKECRIVVSDITGQNQTEETGGSGELQKHGLSGSSKGGKADDFNHQLLDKVIHSRIRFAVLSYLNSTDQAGFVEIREKIKATDGNLSIHMKILESARYVSFKKGFHARRPQTTYRITQEGRDAFNRYTRIISELLSESNPAS